MSVCFISQLKADVVFPSRAEQKQAAHVRYASASHFRGGGGGLRLAGLEMLHPGTQLIRPSCFSAREEEEWLWFHF